MEEWGGGEGWSQEEKGGCGSELQVALIACQQCLGLSLYRQSHIAAFYQC